MLKILGLDREQNEKGYEISETMETLSEKAEILSDSWMPAVEKPMRFQKPDWMKRRVQLSPEYQKTLQKVRDLKLNTVCQEAACPNIPECWSKNHATVMILGKICTRSCSFCNIATGKPTPVDSQEPENVAALVENLDLRHVVITSVDRDDLPDGGATHFVATIEAVRRRCPETSIEILIPDFLKKEGALEMVLAASPDVLNHNVETIPRLYHRVRPQANYFHSLYILKKAKLLKPHIFTKSGFMVGLGETSPEVFQVMKDLRAADVDFLTVGQYLQPSEKHYPVQEYLPLDFYQRLEKAGKRSGFLYVSASPWTRSSYHAGDDFKELQKARAQLNA